ncbi:hypothetical protein VTJ04DRAFT_878 [Mycothermus thermophilus]|uniref:uncharacterized protein n=1 Tax=Humicola insolens TaxID=85995 RepID=UPI0037442DD6
MVSKKDHTRKSSHQQEGWVIIERIEQSNYTADRAPNLNADNWPSNQVASLSADGAGSALNMVDVDELSVTTNPPHPRDHAVPDSDDNHGGILELEDGYRFDHTPPTFVTDATGDTLNITAERLQFLTATITNPNAATALTAANVSRLQHEHDDPDVHTFHGWLDDTASIGARFFALGEPHPLSPAQTNTNYSILPASPQSRAPSTIFGADWSLPPAACDPASDMMGMGSWSETAAPSSRSHKHHGRRRDF